MARLSIDRHGASPTPLGHGGGPVGAGAAANGVVLDTLREQELDSGVQPVRAASAQDQLAALALKRRHEFANALSTSVGVFISGEQQHCTAR